MAFVSRSERDTSVPALRSTTDKVGPGSYSLAPTRKFIPSAAPFASNTKRAFGASSSSSSSHEYLDKASSPGSTPASLAPGSTAQHGAAAASNACSRSVQDFYRSTKSSSFASSTQRFTASKETLGIPGPGAYQTAPQWSRRHAATQAHREAASKKVSELLGPAAAAASSVALAAVQSAVKSGSSGIKAAEVPVLTPPSIPARHQSYGYEQGPGGLLVMQPPPQPVGTADETAATSSSQAATCLGSVPGKAKGTAWAASRTDRWAPQKQQHAPRQQRHHQHQQQQQQRPGPATYHVDGCVTRFRLSPDGQLVPCLTSGRGSFSAAGSAAFLSKVARPHQMDPDPDRSTPGPGAYLKQQQLRPQSAPQPAATGLVPTHSSPQQQRQLFGRGPGRECAIGGLPGVTQPPSVAPGPGSYDLSTTGSLAKPARSSRASLSLGAAAAARAAMTVAHADHDAVLAAAAGFGSTSSRFGDTSSNSPGPGKYTAEQAASMAADAAKKAAAASRRGVFGSAAERFSSGSNSGASSPVAAAAVVAGAGGGASSSLGPGAYDVDCGVAKRVAAGAARPSPGFVSLSQRFPPAAPPVAAPDYCSWDGEPDSLRGDAARLGPGAYVKLDDWGGKAAGRGSMSGSTSRGGRPTYHTAPFGSEAPRSSPGSAAVTAATKGATPGPGAYSNAAVDMRQVFRPMSVPGSGAGFSTGSKRFGSSSVSPGPGTYTEDVANSCSLVRPSYNVTFDC